MMLVDYVQRPLFLALRAYENGEFTLTVHRSYIDFPAKQSQKRRTWQGWEENKDKSDE